MMNHTFLIQAIVFLDQKNIIYKIGHTCNNYVQVCVVCEICMVNLYMFSQFCTETERLGE